MASRQNRARRDEYNRTSYRTSRNAYQYGSAAEAYREEEVSPRQYRPRRVSSSRRRAREAQARAFALAKVSALIALMAVFTFAVISYVNLTSSVSASQNRISRARQKIESVRLSNDQRLEQIESAINLDTIKYIAINELGMQYAEGNQIITYSNASDDYVYQVMEVN